MEKLMDSHTILYKDASIRIEKIVSSASELMFEFGENVQYLRAVEQFSTEKRKCEYLSVRLALRHLLGRDVSVIYDSNGKPFLEDKSFNISISHTNNWVAVMVHPTMQVGIDIEKPTEKIKNIYTRFLSLTEQNELSQGRDISLLQLAWSAKEALYKIIGKEAVDFKTQLQILAFEPKNAGMINAVHLLTNIHYELMYLRTPDFNLVYCLS